MYRRQNELVGKFKKAAGDMVIIRGQVIEYTYIPTGILIFFVNSHLQNICYELYFSSACGTHSAQVRFLA